MKYGIGQKVKIKDFSELVKEYGVEPNGSVIIGNCYFDRQMKVYCGEEYTIVSTFPGGYYELDVKDDGYWYFTSEMFAEEKPKTVDKPKAEAAETAKPKRTYARKQQ